MALKYNTRRSQSIWSSASGDNWSRKCPKLLSCFTLCGESKPLVSPPFILLSIVCLPVSQAPDVVMTIDSLIGYKDSETGASFLNFHLLCEHTKVGKIIVNSPQHPDSTTPTIVSLPKSQVSTYNSTVAVVSPKADSDNDQTKLTENSSSLSSNEVVDTSINTLTDQLNTFTLEKLESPAVISYNSCKYAYSINAEGKITKMACVFKFSMEKPV